MTNLLIVKKIYKFKKVDKSLKSTNFGKDYDHAVVDQKLGLQKKNNGS